MDNKIESLRNNTDFTDDFIDSSVDSSVDKKKRRKKRRKIILIIFGVILAILVIFGVDLFVRINNMFNEIHEEVDTINLRESDLVLGEDPFSILILGLDEGRSDTIMVATVNPNLGTTYLLSISRDTYVPIVGHGTSTRINHAHAYGGVEAAVNTVQEFLNIPIDHFVTLQMNGFGDLIDAVGGVRVYNDTLEFSDDGYHFPMGYNDLSGGAALAFVRMRYQDPDGDYGRQQRQRQVLNAMVSELAGVEVVTRYQNVINATGHHLRTDVAMDEMMSISLNYTASLRNIINLELRGTGQNIRGMALQVVSEEDRIEMSQRLRTHLELE